MNKKDYPPALIKALEQAKLPIESYCKVFDACATWKELNNLNYSDFAVAQKLAALGWMQRKITPIWGYTACMGHKVEFRAFIPTIKANG